MRLVTALLISLCLVPAAAHGASAPDSGMPFQPVPESLPLYGTKPPGADPARQQKVVAAKDGIDLFVETWLPAPKNGRTPPAKVPTILIMTPYVTEGQERYPDRNLEPVIAYFNARGYAVAQHHVRGTGLSGGCLEQTADNQIEDGARIVEYLGKDAPWSNGNVGMYGHSYDAETQVSVAGRGDPNKIKYLKAIVPSATVGGQYEYSYMDGVPYAGQAALSNAVYLADTSIAGTGFSEKQFERFGCQPGIFQASLDQSGNHTAFWDVREYRPGAPGIKAATLFVHGLRDWNVLPITTAGFFDRIPATTPHKGLFGVWEHNYPDKHAGIEPDWARFDFLPMVTAWYDRYLKDLDTDVEDWPAVQVQDSIGQWRETSGFPQTGEPAGQLALGPNGVLGATRPAGASVFGEGNDTGDVPNGLAVFTTPKTKSPLHLTGMPVADLWLQADKSDAHITGTLQVLDDKGKVVEQAGGSPHEIGTFGARSLQHLDAMPENWFSQDAGKPIAPNTALRVFLRFQPNDFVVPKGGQLRLTLSGATAFARQTVPSGNGTTITVLHDCNRTSALRFLMPWSDAPLLNVREVDERDKGRLAANAAPLRETDGGGIASAKVCGKAPERLDWFGKLTPPKGGEGKTSEDVRRGGASSSGSGGGAAAGPRGFTTVRLGRRVLSIAIDRRRLGRALRAGLRVRTRCTGGCRLRFRALAGKRLVGRAKELRQGAGRRTRTIRFTAGARRRYVRRRTLTLRIEVAALDPRGRILRVSRRIRLR